VRIFGVETEYGFAALGADGERLHPTASVDALMRETRKLVPHLHCAGARDVFTANGSRVYIDIGLHPEVASPECTTPDDAVLFTRAGDRLLAQAARAVERTWPGGGVEAVVWKANVDHRTGATWASHESYLHEAPQALFAEQLMSHLVTRVVYTGAGGFDNRARALRFVVSPRAFHLERPVSASSTEKRGIFNTRDEPLATPPYRRLHVLAGESLWSETADYLRCGTTALLVAQIDAGRRPQAGLDLAAPMRALAAVAADVGCTATVELRPRGRLTAIEIQRRLLESVEADLGAGHLPPWAPAVCERWHTVLERLEASPASLVGVLDWPTKLAVLKRQAAAQGIEWAFSHDAALARSHQTSSPARQARDAAQAARLLETDLRFTRLDDGGIFAALDRNGTPAHRIVSPDAVERALREPPSSGRARIRAQCVERLAGKRATISCGWDQIVDHESETWLRLGDPFRSAGEQWEPLPASAVRSAARGDPAVEPIARAISAGAPRQALRAMRGLLAVSGPLSRTACSYCANVIEALVPDYPVPVLRRGAATVSPVLAALFARVADQRDYRLEKRVGTLLYRYHEARGRYDRAREVIERLLARAREAGEAGDIGVLTNNLGYEHLLEGDFEAAEPLLERAIALLEESGRHREAVNMRANLIECRFGRLDPERWDALVPMLRSVNRTLVARGDWRARKTLGLLARLAQSRGRSRAARCWARRALAASQGVPTQLRERDRAYLAALEAGDSEGRRRA
jgi:proteasome accessory factor A